MSEKAYFSRRKAMEELQEIATNYKLHPSILRDVVEGRAQGMTLTDISEMYGHSRNTASKYSRKISEMTERDLAKLLIITGILIGGPTLLEETFETESS